MEVPVRVGPQPINHGVQPRQVKTLNATTPSHTAGGMVRARTGRPAPRQRNQSLFACLGARRCANGPECNRSLVLGPTRMLSAFRDIRGHAGRIPCLDRPPAARPAPRISQRLDSTTATSSGYYYDTFFRRFCRISNH